MWAVYGCGCTDCFLHAIFMDESQAIRWGESKWGPRDPKDPEGWYIKFWATPADIDTSDTGWELKQRE